MRYHSATILCSSLQLPHQLTYADSVSHEQYVAFLELVPDSRSLASVVIFKACTNASEGDGTSLPYERSCFLCVEWHLGEVKLPLAQPQFLGEHNAFRERILDCARRCLYRIGIEV